METNIRYRIRSGQIEIDGTVYIIDRDFSQSILFLRIDKAETGYEAMLSVKSDDDSSLPLFREMAQLTISDELFSQISQFQTIRRGSDTLLRLRGLDTQSSESWETVLIGALHQTFFSGDIGTVCRDFMGFLQKGKINELLLVISSDEETIQNLPWEMVLPKLSPNAYGLPKNTFGLVRSQEKNLEQFDRQGPTVETAPLKMLFIPALPENMPERSKRLEIEEEQRKIIQAVRQLEATGNQRPKLVMEILDCADLAEIKEALQKRSHDIVHISGHGPISTP
ncbi:CHAT domain-containing protein [Spirosoma sp. HMF3257]|uniref:CHAT domain-containing protein n=1 Tax=Spirosoma telluris TaxID=2183553 RepID=A0A327NPR2_9BACT|nr:CHAT domain-containing protein [Spirosoma telluris]RAI77360.1 hypothetical protein HMF3257_30095 [Spirosoma telluris]